MYGCKKMFYCFMALPASSVQPPVNCVIFVVAIANPSCCKLNPLQPPQRCIKGLKFFMVLHSAILLLPDWLSGLHRSMRLLICWHHPTFMLMDDTLTPGLWPCALQRRTPRSRPTSVSPFCFAYAHHHQAGQPSIFTSQVFGNVLLLLVAFWT